MLGAMRRSSVTGSDNSDDSNTTMTCSFKVFDSFIYLYRLRCPVLASGVAVIVSQFAGLE